MKALSLFFLIAASFCAIAQSQEVVSPKTIVKLTPQHFYERSLRIGVEQFVKNRAHSFSLFGTKTHYKKYPIGLNEERFIDGLSGEFQYRYYVRPFKKFHLKKDDPNVAGIFAGVFAQSNRFSDQITSTWRFRDTNGNTTLRHYKYTDDVNTRAFGIIVGAQRTFWKYFLAEFYIGAGYQDFDVSSRGARFEPEGGEVMVRIKDEFPRFPDFQYAGFFPKMGINIGYAF